MCVCMCMCTCTCTCTCACTCVHVSGAHHAHALVHPASGVQAAHARDERKYSETCADSVGLTFATCVCDDETSAIRIRSDVQFNEVVWYRNLTFCFCLLKCMHACTSKG